MFLKTVEKFWSTALLANIICVFVTSMGVVKAAAMPPIKGNYYENIIFKTNKNKNILLNNNK